MPNTSPPMQQSARVALISGSLLMVLGRCLLVPLGDSTNWNDTLDTIASRAGISTTGWLLAMLASALLAYGSATYAFVLDSASYRRVANVITPIISIAWTACAAVCVSGIMMTVAAGESDRTRMIELQETFNSYPAIMIVFLVMLLGAASYVVLGVMLARARVMSRGAIALIAFGGLLTLPTMPGPVQPLLIAAAIILAAGHILALRQESA